MGASHGSLAGKVVCRDNNRCGYIGPLPAARADCARSSRRAGSGRNNHYGRPANVKARPRKPKYRRASHAGRKRKIRRGTTRPQPMAWVRAARAASRWRGPPPSAPGPGDATAAAEAEASAAPSPSSALLPPPSAGRADPRHPRRSADGGGPHHRLAARTHVILDVTLFTAPRVPRATRRLPRAARPGAPPPSVVGGGGGGSGAADPARAAPTDWSGAPPPPRSSGGGHDISCKLRSSCGNSTEVAGREGDGDGEAEPAAAAFAAAAAACSCRMRRRQRWRLQRCRRLAGGAAAAAAS